MKHSKQGFLERKKMKTDRWQKLLLLILVATIISPLKAQVLSEEMKKDIYIMENILDKLLQASRDYYFGGSDIKGFYFDDHGLLFTVNPETSVRFLSMSRGKNREGQVVITPPKEALAISVKEEPNEQEFKRFLTRLDRKINTFLSVYVDNNNFLKPDEEVSVVVFLNRVGFFNNEKKARVYRVAKKDILAHRRNRLSDNEFKTRVKKQLVSSEDHAEEIEIMGVVLETALGGSKRSRFLPGSKVNGIFLKDLGVMFNLSSQFFSSSMEEVLREYLESSRTEARKREEALVRAEVYSKWMEKNAAEKIRRLRKKLEEFETDVIKTMGTYGSSLRFLPEDQSVFVLFATDGLSTGDVKNVMIRLKKSDLIAYSQAKLDLSALRKRAQIVEY